VGFKQIRSEIESKRRETAQAKNEIKRIRNELKSKRQETKQIREERRSAKGEAERSEYRNRKKRVQQEILQLERATRREGAAGLGTLQPPG
jgi:hypothetical protein